MIPRSTVLAILLLSAFTPACGGGGGEQAELAIQDVQQIDCGWSVSEDAYLCTTSVVVSISGSRDTSYMLDVAFETELLYEPVEGSAALNGPGTKDGEHVVGIPAYISRTCVPGLGLATVVEAELRTGNGSNELAGSAVRYNVPLHVSCL